MESSFLLAVIISSSCSCYGNFLESAVYIEVTGDCTVRSGVSQYTAYGNPPKLEYLNCMVRNDTGKLKKVTIEKNSETIHDVKEDKDVGLWYKAFDGIGEENDGGTYTCRAIFETENQAFSTTYYVEKNVEVLMVDQSYVIASDVGSRVYAGEQISIACKGFYETGNYVDLYEYSYSFNSNFGEIVSSVKQRCPVYLIDDPCPTIEVPFDDFPRNVTCDLRPFTKGLDPLDPFDESLNRGIRSICSKPIYLELDVSPKLSVTLEPSRFDRLTKELNFACTSDPPRLMYWTILTTDNSEMIDIQRPPAISADTEINIKQKAGRSTLKIQIKGKDDEGGNGIQTVICSTYDTKAHVIKTAQLGTLDEHGSTFATAKVVSLSVTALLSLVIVVLLLVVIFMCVRMRQIKVLLHQSPAGCSVDDHEAPPQPVMHVNPTYVPYSDTDESPP